MITVHIIPTLSDNYSYILEAENGDVGIIDPGEAAPILKALEDSNLKPTHIFLTHHHGDHIAGVREILETHSCNVLGPAAEATKIGMINQQLDENSELEFGGEPIQIIETPGHTLGQINFFFPVSKLIFSGDTLFVMGCGRVFEGTMEQMHASLQKLAQLPDETQVYCGHEYTLANVEFLMHAAPENEAIKKRYLKIKDLRSQNKPTIPSTIGMEKQTNLFILADNTQEFERLRKQKDSF